MLYDDFDDLPRDCEVSFENMSEDEDVYRLMNQEDPMYMGSEINEYKSGFYFGFQ